MSRRAEFGLGATFKRPDGTLHNAANQDQPFPELADYAERPERPKNPATITSSTFSQQGARDRGFYDQADMRGEDW